MQRQRASAAANGEHVGCVPPHSAAAHLLLLLPRHGAVQEAEVMALRRHPCVVNFLGICTLPPAILTGARQLTLWWWRWILAAALIAMQR
jgi:hypothetical protein